MSLSISSSPICFQLLSLPLRQNRVFLLHLLSLNGLILQYLDWEFRTDRELVERAVRQSGLAVRFARGAAVEQGVMRLAVKEFPYVVKGREGG
jgi:hypothetical protein